MRKVIMLLLSLSLVVMAQMPKVAVGAIGKEPEDFKALKGLSIELEKAITKSRKYTAVDRSEAILKQLGKEHERQRSGAVDDEQIKELGKMFAVDYLCIVESSELRPGEYMLSAKFVNVVTAATADGMMGSELSNLADTKELMRVAEVLTEQLLKEAEREFERQKEEQARQEREKERQEKLDAYQDFTQLERFGTFALNHVLGLGSLLIMENTGTAGWIALGETAGTLLCVFGSLVKMPDRNSYSDDVYGDDNYEIDRTHAVGLKYFLIVSGLVVLGSTEIANAYSSFTYNKPKPVAGFADPRNFRLAVLPNRNGDGMAYGLMYKVRF